MNALDALYSEMADLFRQVLEASRELSLVQGANMVDRAFDATECATPEAGIEALKKLLGNMKWRMEQTTTSKCSIRTN